MYTVLSQEKTTSPYFQGVYSRDTLPPLEENMCAIVNSDDSSQPGTHCEKESEDFEGRDSGWTLDEILRLEVRTNRYSPFRGSSSFIEVPKQIAETKAIINVINKRTLSVSCGLFSQLFTPTPATPTKRQVMSPT
ncbi:hypothetical protein TNCV_1906981 [Trichonephila clavipes]|nr:hypothetical protein TNCV_1906981 [Trichonephila clavipes]